jgi:hypothetical protein
VADDEGLAIAAGSEVRGAVILPPTLAGWQRFLELAPTSGESYTTLKEIGLSWWDRKIPTNLLSSAKEKEAEEAAPPPAATDAPVDAARPYEEARRTIEALGLSPEKHNSFMHEIDKAQGMGAGHRVAPIIEQAFKTAGEAEEARMGELLRRARDAEEGPPTGTFEVAHAREVLVRAGIHIDPAKLRAVGRLGECCAPNACVRDQARKALRDAGIHASIVRDRLLFQLGQP